APGRARLPQKSVTIDRSPTAAAIPAEPSGSVGMCCPIIENSRRRSARQPQSLWQATKHEHYTCPVGSAQADAPEVFGVESDDFPAAKHMCESSVDRESKCPISSRQHDCKGLERKVVSKQRKIPQTRSLAGCRKGGNTNFWLAKPTGPPGASAAILSLRSWTSPIVALRLPRAS